MVRISTLALLLAGASAPVGSSVIPTTVDAAQPAATSGEAQFNAVIDSIFSRDYDRATRLLATLRQTMPDTKAARAVGLNLEALIAAGQGHEDEASARLAQSEQLLTDQADLVGMNYLGLLVSGRRKLTGAYFDHMISRYPDKVRELDNDYVRPLLREDKEEPTRVLENRKIALAQIGFGGADSDYIAEAAAGLLLARGDQAGAAALVRDIDEPTLLQSILIQRRYASLWPALEVQVGPHLTRSLDSLIRAAERMASEKPDDHAARAHLINVYRVAKRYDRLDALRESLPTTAAALAGADQDTGWAINNLAYAEYERGRPDEADRLFAALTGAVNQDWRISMMINRVELLVSNDQFARALPLIEEAQKVDQSPYATQLLRRLQYCSLVRLQRGAEAAKLRPALMSHMADARGPTVDGLVCAGEIDAAEQLALGLADKPEDQADLLRALQPQPLSSDDPSAWRRWAALRQRPAMAALYARLGRDLPPALLVAQAAR